MSIFRWFRLKKSDGEPNLDPNRSGPSEPSAAAEDTADEVHDHVCDDKDGPDFDV